MLQAVYGYIQHSSNVIREEIPEVIKFYDFIGHSVKFTAFTHRIGLFCYTTLCHFFNTVKSQ